MTSRPDPLPGFDDFIEMVRSGQSSRAREYLLAQIARARASGDSDRLGQLLWSLARTEFDLGNRDAARATLLAKEEAAIRATPEARVLTSEADRGAR